MSSDFVLNEVVEVRPKGLGVDAHWRGTITGFGASGDIFVNPDDTISSDIKCEREVVFRPSRSPVQSPSHYDLPGGIQVIDLIRDESFLRGNLMKYIFRAPHKGNELEDLKKAAEYLKWEIERVENEHK